MTLWDYVRFEDLPKSAKSLAEIIGKELTFALFRHFAGQKIYIPIYPPQDNKILQLIGEEALALLIDRFGETYLYIAPCKRALNYARTLQLLKKQHGHTESSLQLADRDKERT